MWTRFWSTNKTLIGWAIVAVIDLCALIKVYWQLPSIASDGLATSDIDACKAFPFTETLKLVFQPRFWLLWVGILILIILGTALLSKLQVNLLLKRRGITKILSFVLVAALIVILAMITKKGCWQ